MHVVPFDRSHENSLIEDFYMLHYRTPVSLFGGHATIRIMT